MTELSYQLIAILVTRTIIGAAHRRPATAACTPASQRRALRVHAGNLAEWLEPILEMRAQFCTAVVRGGRRGQPQLSPPHNPGLQLTNMWCSASVEPADDDETPVLARAITRVMDGRFPITRLISAGGAHDPARALGTHRRCAPLRLQP
jgi:hypothetical protein